MVIELAHLLIGTLCIFLGYKLLMRALSSETDGSAQQSNHAVLIKRSVPGVLFAVFGAGMVVYALMHSSELRHQEPAAKQESSETPKSPPAQAARRKHVRPRDGDQNPSPASSSAQPKSSPPAQPASDDGNQAAPQPKPWKPGRA
jgi:hypothetical protein